MPKKKLPREAGGEELRAACAGRGIAAGDAEPCHLLMTPWLGLVAVQLGYEPSPATVPQQAKCSLSALLAQPPQVSRWSPPTLGSSPYPDPFFFLVGVRKCLVCWEEKRRQRERMPVLRGDSGDSGVGCRPSLQGGDVQGRRTGAADSRHRFLELSWPPSTYQLQLPETSTDPSPMYSLTLNTERFHC